MENSYTSTIIAKKLSSMLRAILYTVRKGICKRKLLLLDLHLMMKRGKFALGNLMHHHNNRGPIVSIDKHKKEYEFSIPKFHAHQFMTRPFHLTKRFSKKKNKNKGGNEEVDDLEGVSHVLEMMLNASNYEEKDVEVQSSPFLQRGSSFRNRSPMVRQLIRITDSPYPLQDTKEDYSTDHVDEEAEAFIQRFYNNLQRQMSI